MQIGTLEQVNDLRAIWPLEPRLSDWLTTEEGLEVMARDLGITVENARREVRPGDYPCDIVGHLADDESHIVIIENQFGKTNHDHLGKLMTYAAVNRATTAVWIAEEVSDDHRSVIDWLNDNTPPHLNFFLAKMRAFRIGNSPVAPQLDVICRPNAEVKKQRTQAANQQSQLVGWRQELWRQIHRYIEDRRPPFRLQSPSGAHWSTVRLGKSGFQLAMLLNTQRECVAIEFLAAPVGWRDAAFEQLKARRNQIEAHVGTGLVWECKPNIKRARIFLEHALDPRDEANLTAIQTWFDENLRRFYGCFGPIVRELQAPISLTESLNQEVLDDEAELGSHAGELEDTMNYERREDAEIA